LLVPPEGFSRETVGPVKAASASTELALKKYLLFGSDY